MNRQGATSPAVEAARRNLNNNQLEAQEELRSNQNGFASPFRDLESQNNVDVIDLIESPTQNRAQDGELDFDQTVPLNMQNYSPYMDSNQTPYEHEEDLRRRGYKIEHETPANMFMLPTERLHSNGDVSERKNPDSERQRQQVLAKAQGKMIPSTQEKQKK